MKKEKYYWKVVREIDGKYYSAAIYYGKYCLEYKIGEEIVAPIQGIFIFDTKEDAVKFKNGTPGFEILKVKSTGEEIATPIFYHIEDLEDNYITTYESRKFPPGTKCFKSIIPIEVLDD